MVRTMGLRGSQRTEVHIGRERDREKGKAQDRHLSMAGMAPRLPRAEELERSCSGCTRGQRSTCYVTATFPMYHTGLDFLDIGLDDLDLLTLLE